MCSHVHEKLGGVDYCFQKHRINNSITEHGIMNILKEIRSINGDELHFNIQFQNIVDNIYYF